MEAWAMEAPILLDQVTPEWLAARLAAKGYLPVGRVTGIERARVFSHNAQSARLERPLLERYHRALLAHGVGDYSWEACWYDYRVSATIHGKPAGMTTRRR